MGSVKDLVRDDSVYGKLYIPPTSTDFGRGVWRVSGNFSVKDLKREIPPSNIKHKPEALTMTTAAFFEHLSNVHPDIPTCYLGLVDQDGKIVSLDNLLSRGATSNHIAMKLAHTPDSFSGGDLARYRATIKSGDLQCAVADVESIFRLGLPLGSSVFKSIFGAVGMAREYQSMATYDQVVLGLDQVRAKIAREGLASFGKLESILRDLGLNFVPNPGFVFKKPIYDSTTKFETGGDRKIGQDEERVLSGLSGEGYDLWTNKFFPQSAEAQIKFAEDRGLLNIDGKEESVTHLRMPGITDFAMTPDENRLMIRVKIGGVLWIIPSNKEIARAKFTEAGVDSAIHDARKFAEGLDTPDNWRPYFATMAKQRGIDVAAVSEHSCKLMSNAVGEVANRVLRSSVFDVPPLESWVDDFMPYASKVEMQN